MNTKRKHCANDDENGNFASNSRFAENGAICQEQCGTQHTHTHSLIRQFEFCDRFPDGNRTNCGDNEQPATKMNSTGHLHADIVQRCVYLISYIQCLMV